jgi:mono/diheme cytochrome c family protein
VGYTTPEYKNDRGTMNTKLSSLMLLLVFALSLGILRAEPNADKGEKLFKANCAACHKVKGKLVGPALGDAPAKYANDMEWLYKWVKNSPALIKSGDAKAVALYEENGKAAMNAFPQLADADIDDIFAYLKNPPAPAGAPVVTTTPQTLDPSIYYTLLVLLGILALVSVIFVIMAAALVTAVRAKEGGTPFTMGEVFNRAVSMGTNKYAVTIFTIVLVVGGFAVTTKNAREVGLHQGYMPTQPIAFSHKLHAGEYKVDCKYCHSGTTKGKSAWIPSTNVCMNCHKAIQNRHEPEKRAKGYEADDAVSPEIMKIYQAVGWDAAQGKYIEGYEQKPVEWVRIHNLPDHSYFNHAQHVVVGGLECQTCHGEVQEMEVVYQYSNLGMGWCVNCHRETKVKVLGKETDMTVEDMGGLNCARCHY